MGLQLAINRRLRPFVVVIRLKLRVSSKTIFKILSFILCLQDTFQKYLAQHRLMLTLLISLPIIYALFMLLVHLKILLETRLLIYMVYNTYFYLMGLSIIHHVNMIMIYLIYQLLNYLIRFWIHLNLAMTM
jgi:hypothetical protein